MHMVRMCTYSKMHLHCPWMHAHMGSPKSMDILGLSKMRTMLSACAFGAMHAYTWHVHAYTSLVSNVMLCKCQIVTNSWSYLQLQDLISINASVEDAKKNMRGNWALWEVRACCGELRLKRVKIWDILCNFWPENSNFALKYLTFSSSNLCSLLPFGSGLLIVTLLDCCLILSWLSPAQQAVSSFGS